MLPKLLFATPDGTVLEHPSLHALVRSGDDVLVPAAPAMALPPAARLVRLPGRRPVGYDAESDRLEVLDTVRIGRKRVVPEAVAAVLPPGFTRTFLPVARNDGGPELTQWAYTAAGWSERGAVAWALRTDPRRHWDPVRFSTAQLEERIAERHRELPENPLLAQLERCAREYCCFTAQNIFYRRDEGGLPTSTGCNARCVGCINAEQEGRATASMHRIRKAPTAQDIAAVGAAHLARAQGRVMVSFGQGCEGEPLSRGAVLAEATRLMRRATRRGSINLNTNASLPAALAALFDAGLDAVRVSLNSAHPELYTAYYRPRGYGFDEVRESLALARRRKAYLALNLLLMPGVTDRLGEVERLLELIIRYRVDQVQARSLCIDPDVYVPLARDRGAGGPALGVAEMLRRFKREAPWLTIGNFSRAKSERASGPPAQGRGTGPRPTVRVRRAAVRQK